MCFAGAGVPLSRGNRHREERSDAAIQGPPPQPTDPLGRFARDDGGVSVSTPPRSSFAAPHDGVGSTSGRDIPALRIWRLPPARKVNGIEPLRTPRLPVAMSDFGRERTGSFPATGSESRRSVGTTQTAYFDALRSPGAESSMKG